LKNTLIIIAVSIAVGFGLGTQLFPKIKEQTVEVEKEVIRKDIVTVIKETVRPDGSKETTTTTTDKSKENKESKSSHIVAKSDWHLSIKGSKTLTDSEIIYGVTAERRILGDLFVGAEVTTQKTIGLVVGLEF
jgi:3-polyprenyl-4-hydroxybenzoate decarboxylase